MLFENVYDDHFAAQNLHHYCHDVRKPLDTPHALFKRHLMDVGLSRLTFGDHLGGYKYLARLFIQSRGAAARDGVARLLRSSAQVSDQLEKITTVLVNVLRSYESSSGQIRNQITSENLLGWVLWCASRLDALLTSSQCMHFEGPAASLRLGLSRLQQEASAANAPLEAFLGNSVATLEKSRDLLISLRAAAGADVHATSWGLLTGSVDDLRARMRARGRWGMLRHNTLVPRARAAGRGTEE